MSDSLEVPREVQELVAHLPLVPLRRGSVTERHVRCGKPECTCSKDDGARHGPYFSVSRVVEGKTRSTWLSEEEAEIARRQTEAARKFRDWIEAYWRVSERWADVELKSHEATSSEVAKKGGSRANSQRRSRPKSRS